MKAFILCNGEIPPLYLFKKNVTQADLIIAADGGAYHANELGITANYIIGDLDSYTPSGDEASQIIKDPDQETNDLEKALNLALKKSAKHAIVVGATGRRLDHTLKNLSVLLQFHPKFETLFFLDRYCTIQLVDSPFSQNIEPGTSVSLFPISGSVEGITTRGLQYPLTNGVLRNGVQDGSSNKTVKKSVEIEFKKGDLLLLINHKPSE
ncbi:MAG: thiamine diphosphokinase [Balneolaceae bacterium]|nr:MAG: thiamine diphosphokinase [Balneolaceae bacterium]